MEKHLQNFFKYLSGRGFSPRTIRAYEHDLGKLLQFFESIGKGNVSAITKTDIREFLSSIADNNAQITLARKLSAAKSFFKYLKREDILKKNPAEDIESPKIPEKEPCYLNNEEYQRLIQFVKNTATPYYRLRDIAIVITFLNTGVRLSELVGLTLNDVDLYSRSIKVHGKGNRERTIPLNDDVETALKKYLEKRPEVEIKNLFISRLGGGISSGGVYHLIKRYLKEAGIKKEKVGVHSLRHSFSASLLNRGINLFVIQQLLGHKNLETTCRYLHINNVDLRNAVDSLVLNKK